MTTLRREARKIGDNPQTQDAIDYAKEQAEKIIDKLLTLILFSIYERE